MTTVISWLGRKAVLYILLVAAIAAATIGLPWLRQGWTGAERAQQQAEVFAEADKRFTIDRENAIAAFKQQATDLRSRSIYELDRQIDELESERSELERKLSEAPGRFRLALRGVDAVLEVERWRLRLAVIGRELVAARSASDLVSSRGSTLRAHFELREKEAQAGRAILACDAATDRLNADRMHWHWRPGQREERQARTNEHKARCDTARAALDARHRARDAQKALAAAVFAKQALFTRAATNTEALRHVGDKLAADTARAQIAWSGTIQQKLGLWAQRIGLRSLLWQAAVALAVIVATPFLIRLLCYFVLAPAAMRRPKIRLRTLGAVAAVLPPTERSTTSVGVRLAAGEELLVRQDYLQTTSHVGVKETQWFLDWRHPVTSIATGLTFLTRIRGDGEVTTVSAVRDPLAEVTVLTLPEGANCVLQPRALAAIVQPIGRPLRITTQWRLGSLSAWLTLQLRFVIFHGPARLVAKGGRGVRIERADSGRVFGQDQLVGFSTDLAYSVTRTETFWPYLLGREQLLKDQVTAGAGLLIIEEAPLSARKGEVRRGIEGLIDASLKVFGI